MRPDAGCLLKLSARRRADKRRVEGSRTVVGRDSYDVIVVGAGTAGLPAAIFAAARGMRVLLLEKLDRIGGTLHLATGQMSAAGTSLQRERGIQDTPDLHFADVMRISHGTANAELVRLAVDIAAETIEWLRANGFDFHPDCPAVVFNHEAYSVPRTYWGTNKALSILAVLERLVRPHLESGAITLRTGTTVSRLLMDGATRVAGVVARGAVGTESELRARQVVLTAGGYGGNPAMFQRYERLPLYGPLPQPASGEVIEAAVAMGAGFRNARNFLPSFGGIEDEPGSHRIVWTDRPVLQPQWRKPWEIYVNRAGQRFVAEDNESNDVRERALLGQPDMLFWVVYDARIERAAPPILPTFDAERLAGRFAGHPSFTRAGTLDELARKAGIEPAGLAASVAAYNRSVADGDDPLGRKHMPLPILEPPFIALRNHGVAVKSAGGVDVDRRLRVRLTDGRVVENLFAGGETIGGGLLSGNAFVGGMSLTPWLGFGRLIGRDFIQ
ncbi:MAG: FAD-dependent oxidoreductase [Alphaproteobacteria bacterium]|nr:FAD-dependent oxidoreductase [Alphaproteobacteria bacterium]